MLDSTNISSIDFDFVTNIDYLNRVLLSKMMSTEEKWNNLIDFRQNAGAVKMWRHMLPFWYNSVEVGGGSAPGTWKDLLLELPPAAEVEKSIQYIKQSQPETLVAWKLEPIANIAHTDSTGDTYVNWWCHMRNFAEVVRPDLLKIVIKNLSGSTQLENLNIPLGKWTIYPTLEKWSKFLGLQTDDLSVTDVQEKILVQFTEWLVKLAHDRQMFGSEKIYNPEIPRIILVNGKEELISATNIQTGIIQARDASVVDIMDEGRKILSERGDNTDFWFRINEKYNW